MATASTSSVQTGFATKVDGSHCPIFDIPYLEGKNPTPISRLFLAAHYRCKNTGLIVPLNPLHNPSPSASTVPVQMLHPSHEQNPNLPAAPGLPGSMLSSRAELEPENFKGEARNGVPVYRLWVKWKGGDGQKGERICYFGEYELTKGGRMSGQDFSAMDKKVGVRCAIPG